MKMAAQTSPPNPLSTVWRGGGGEVSDAHLSLRDVEMTALRESPDLYEAILSRRSVRRYAQEPLDPETLAQVQHLADSARPLVATNRMVVTRRDDLIRQDLVTLLGGYGRLITPPHALAPYIVGERHLLTDLGYRVEQIVVRMTALGVGSCYTGALPREDEMRRLLDIPAGGRIGAFVVFGRPAESLTGQSFNRLLRTALGRTREPELSRIFFQDSADNPTQPPEALRPLILAAARAPSACNAQPWRFLWHAGRLVLFVTRNNPKYGKGPSEEYCLYDGGIAMANIALAMEARRVSAQWQVLEPDDIAVPAHPSDWFPLASLQLG